MRARAGGSDDGVVMRSSGPKEPRRVPEIIAGGTEAAMVFFGAESVQLSAQSCVSIERDERQWGTADRCCGIAASRLPLLFGGAAGGNPGGGGPGGGRGVADLPDDALGAGAGVYGAGAVSAGVVLHAASGACGGFVRSPNGVAGLLCAAVWSDAVAAGHDHARREQRDVDLWRWH